MRHLTIVLLLVLATAGCGGGATRGPSLPGVVAGLSAAGGDGEVILDWSPTGGATSYRIYWSESSPPGAGAAVLEAAAPPFTHHGLVNGRSYYYTVRAVSADGEGPAGALVSADPAALRPGTPAIVVVPVDGAIDVRWTDIAGAGVPRGQARVTSYELYFATTPGALATGTRVASVRSPLHLAGLENGTTYWLALVAVGERASSEPSVEVEVMPVAVLPEAPTGLVATAGVRSVTLAWDDVAGVPAPVGHAAVSGYAVYFSSGAQAASALVPVAHSPFIHTTLAAGVEYRYVVRAVGARGLSAPTAEVAATPVFGAPAAPGEVAAAAGDGSVSVAWTDLVGATPPAGESPVASYTLYWSTTGDPQATGTAVDDVRSPFTHSSLSNGITYHYVLVAHGVGGASPGSLEVAAVPTARLPDAAVGLTATGGVERVALAWTDVAGVPPAVGHAAVTGYRLYWSTDAGMAGAQVLDGVRSPVEHGQRVGGTRYYYVLRAVGAHGESAASTQASAVAGYPRPAAPTGLVATAGDGQITLTWTSLVGSPAAPGQAPVTSYSAYWSTTPGAGTSGTRIAGVDTGWSQPSRVNGTTYYYVVTAISAGGESLPSSEAFAVPTATLPSAPTGVRAIAGSGQVTLTWDDRTNVAVPGQPTVLSYDVYRSTTAGVGTGGTLLTYHTSGLVDGGLTDGITYYYVVVANAAPGSSPPSVEVSAVAGVTYPLGGVVSGLLGGGLVLSDPSGGQATVSTDGPFTLDAGVAPGAAYAVTVEVAPSSPAQNCLVLRGQGTMPAAAVANVEVVCSLQVATFNLEFFAATSSATKQLGVADVIDANGFDAVAVEEVADGALGPFISTYLAPADPASWGFEIGNTGGAQQVGVLYRKGVFAVVESFELTNATSAGIIDETASQWSGMRLPLRVTLQVAGSAQTVTLLVLHLKANTCSTGDSACCDKRKLQADDLAVYLTTHATEPIVTLGDYNEVLDQNGTPSAGQALGICTSYGYDSLAAMEALTGFEFLTRQPADMLGLDTYYTYVSSPHSTIDQLFVTPALLPLVLPLDGSGHKAEVVMHRNATISDHMPPYFYLAVE